MGIIKCKMCGGDIEMTEGKMVATCEYCGNTMTLPKLDEEQRLAAFNRGNYFRRNGEFDKAISVYERIIQEDDTDAEAHWCIVLSKFGIEYVEDPKTKEWIPTCHRASYDNILQDVDYEAAISNSDSITREYYMTEAKRISEIQKEILITSQNEEAFDIFICYKESDDIGNRTIDSTLAQDIYYQLTDSGYRVFFSRITLEDKGGQEYEPYIFAALHSAKVMIVVGTKQEYYSAVWVKNEWSRFLTIMKHDKEKLLIPCYRDMNPYDIPDELSVLQAYDMSKIGFVQDLLRGIGKIIKKDEHKATEKVIVQNSEIGNVSAMLERGYMALEDEEWDKAAEFFEKVLNQDSRCAKAYMGEYLCEVRCSCFEQSLQKVLENIKNNKAVRKKINFNIEEKVENVIQKYTIEEYPRFDRKTIAPILEFGITYTTYMSYSVREKYEVYKNLFCSDKRLSRVKQFAEKDYFQEISDKFEFFLDELKFVKNEFEEKEERSIQEAKNKFEQEFTRKLERIQKLYEEAAEERECYYCMALNKMKNAYSQQDWKDIEEMFKKLGEYKDSKKLILQCKDNIQLVIQAEQREREREIEQKKKEEMQKEREENNEYVRKMLLFLIFFLMLFLLFLASAYPAMME